MQERWQQRLKNFSAALAQLQAAVSLANSQKLSDLEKQGLIQAFEFTHELAWNVMRDFFIYQGQSSLNGSRDATREAFHKGLIVDGNGWMEMIKSRNQTSHTYNRATADQIAGKITSLYAQLFKDFKIKMDELDKKALSEV